MAVDATYGPKIYEPAGANGGDTMVVASGGLLSIQSGGVIDFESGAALKLAGVDKTAAIAAMATSSGGTAYETQAAAGNAQANATAIIADFVLVTAADATKGVVLPVPVAGRMMIVKNNVNAVLKVWPASGGQINAVGADTALSMAALTSAVFVASSATQWFTVPLLPS